ncbi:MAG: HAD family hydrolase [Bacillota bacterium]|nr:HAD family hydrolase [Bacillota bacterium]
MKYKAIIFDMDGTLLDTSVDVHNCVNIFLKKYGYSLKTPEDIQRGMGGGAKKLIHMMLPEGTSEEDFETFFNDYLPYYETHGKDLTKPYPGIVELLRELKEKGIKLAVVSSKPHKGVLSLCDFYFKDLFDIALGDTFSMKLKPAPDCIYYVLDKLGISKEEALYIGDSEPDVQVSKNANMDGVAVSWGYRSKETLLKECPMFIADNIEELRDIIFKD